MATWLVTTPEIGIQPITTSNTTSQHPVLKKVIARDGIDQSGLGEGEFIYLQGVANTVPGSLVTFDGGGQTALTLGPSTSLSAVTGRPVAVAMSTNGATGYGWYMIRGNAPVLKDTTFASSLLAFSSGSAVGRIVSTTASGKAIERMYSLASTVGSANSTTTATSVDTVVMHMEYPSIEAVPPPVTG